MPVLDPSIRPAKLPRIWGSALQWTRHEHARACWRPFRYLPGIFTDVRTITSFISHMSVSLIRFMMLRIQRKVPRKMEWNLKYVTRDQIQQEYILRIMQEMKFRIGYVSIIFKLLLARTPLHIDAKIIWRTTELLSAPSDIWKSVHAVDRTVYVGGPMHVRLSISSRATALHGITYFDRL